MQVSCYADQLEKGTAVVIALTDNDDPHATIAVGVVAFKNIEKIHTWTEIIQRSWANPTSDVMESFEKGQVSTGGIPGINSFDIEIAYKDTKYPFHVERIAADVYHAVRDVSRNRFEGTQASHGQR